jgi:membrane-bound lytic murein transglycosylase MltF
MFNGEGNCMTKRTLNLLLAGFAVVLAGCTPFSENLARKPTDDPTTQDGRGDVSSAQTTEAVPAMTLDSTTRGIVKKYGPTIQRYADRYGFDWRLILAVMKQESRFAPQAQSHRGASGLMQIMPLTEEEVARVLDLQDLSHPANNIKGGIFYLKKLYDLFEGADQGDRLKLALAAYNAGVGRVYDAQEVAAYLHDNPTRWQAVRDALPLLSKRYYTLHRSVWNSDRPKSGWFGSSRQTVAYVASVLSYYDEYRLLLN